LILPNTGAAAPVESRSGLSRRRPQMHYLMGVTRQGLCWSQSLRQPSRGHTFGQSAGRGVQALDAEPVLWQSSRTLPPRNRGLSCKSLYWLSLVRFHWWLFQAAWRIAVPIHSVMNRTRSTGDTTRRLNPVAGSGIGSNINGTTIAQCTSIPRRICILVPAWCCGPEVNSLRGPAFACCDSHAELPIRNAGSCRRSGCACRNSTGHSRGIRPAKFRARRSGTRHPSGSSEHARRRGGLYIAMQ
jgi:hypothetical protein